MDAERLLQAFSHDETLALVAALPADVLTNEVMRRGLEVPAAVGATATQGVEVSVETVETSGASETEVEAPTPFTKESLTEQLVTSYKGYKTTVEVLNQDRKEKDQIVVAAEAIVQAEYDAWVKEKEQDGSLAYIRAAMEADPELVATLTATPNVLATGEEVTRAGIKFGEKQPRKTEVWSDNLTRRPAYKPEEISGTDPANGKSVMFSVRLSKPTPGMQGTGPQQKDKLAVLQADTPSLRFTTPLEDATYVETLRAGDDPLVGPGTFEKTITRYPQMTPKQLDGFSFGPRSFVYDDGRRYLGDSFVEHDANVAVVVG